MAIARTQAVSATAASVALTATNAGDLILVWAYSSSTTIPTIPAGFITITATAGTQQACACGWKVSAGGETTSGTWTNATSVVCMVYRGASVIGGIGTLSSGSSTSAATAGATMQDTSGSSWLVQFVGAKSNTATWASTSGTAWTTQAQVPTALGADTSHGVTSAAGTGNGYTVSPTSRWFSLSVEIKVTPPNPYFVAAGTAIVGTTSTSPQFPVNALANDIALVICQTSNQACASGGAVTELDDQNHMGTGTAGAAGAVRLAVFWRRCTGSETAGTGLQITAITGTDHVIAQLLLFRGCKTSGNPWSDVGTGIITPALANNQGCNWTTLSSPVWVNGVSTAQPGTLNFLSTVANSLNVAVFGHGVDSASAQFSSVLNQLAASGTVTGFGGGFSVGSAVIPTVGSSAQVGSLLSGGTASLIGMMQLLLVPQPTGPTIYYLAGATGSFSESGNATLLELLELIGAPGGSYTESGGAASMFKLRSLLGATASYTEAGNSAALVRSRRFVGSTSSYIATGNAAALIRSRLPLVSATGSYTETGGAAAFKASRLTVGSPATYAATGSAAGMVVTRKLVAGTGAFVRTGGAAFMAKFVTLIGVKGNYIETGGSALFVHRSLSVGATGTYAVSGNATGIVSRRAVGGRGTFTETGGAAAMAKFVSMAGSSGVFTRTGNAAALVRSLRLALATGSFTRAGGTASLIERHLLSGVSGTFIETGGSAFFQIVSALGHYVMMGGSGAFLKTGSSASLLAARKLVALNGSFTEAGAVARLLRAYKVIGQTGVYNETGGVATLLRRLRAIALSGAFHESGGSAFFIEGLTMGLATGLFTETGGLARFLYNRQPLQGAEGHYFVVGNEVDMEHGGFIVFGPDDICWIDLRMATSMNVTPVLDTESSIRLPLVTSVTVEPDL